MPSSTSFTRILPLLGVIAVLSTFTTACRQATHSTAGATSPDAQQRPTAVESTAQPGKGTPSSPGVLPRDVAAIAKAFTVAYAGHDARDGGDRSYADAGVRAAKFAAGPLVDALRQERPAQQAPWDAWRTEKALVAAKVTSVLVPDGAPAPTSRTALARATYVLTTTPRTGSVRTDREQLALRLDHTSSGWRVTALPWA